jgi:hypothetical protein
MNSEKECCANLTYDDEISDDVDGWVRGHLADVGPVVSARGGLDAQAVVVGVVQRDGVPVVGAERLPADGEQVQRGVLAPEPGNLKAIDCQMIGGNEGIKETNEPNKSRRRKPWQNFGN